VSEQVTVPLDTTRNSPAVTRLLIPTGIKPFSGGANVNAGSLLAKAPGEK
jgi:hypothetical protein